MTVEKYLENINRRFKTGISTEHTYRGDLQNLLESFAPKLTVTNEATRIKCGAPDYIITKNEIPVGYIEAKDVGADLSSKNYFEQLKRYKASLDNLIITDYLDFHFYVEGELITSIHIGEIAGENIVPVNENIPFFENLLQKFLKYEGQTIIGSKKLAALMASKARMLAHVIENALAEDSLDSIPADNSLQAQFSAFKEILIYDITVKDFADIYAQTIAYGMFAARVNDESLGTFSRQKAAELIPRSNPFLRKLFQFVAGYDLDKRIAWNVDLLADLFRATDVAALLENFGAINKMNDPIIHFYEDFLAQYDPKLRKSRGVWYTPEPVVNFIVRAVDEILSSDFGLDAGLSYNGKVKIKVSVPSSDKQKSKGFVVEEKEVHKVQILDPATGTGTFLAEVVKQVHKTFKDQKGLWSGYVKDHLIPRLNGFEILMASYAMAHLKLTLLLNETGYKSKEDQRLKIYLTNSLEEQHPDSQVLFAQWLSAEANEANQIKRETPVMVVLGNPPYSGISMNKGQWITNLIEDYKYVEGVHFNERKHWLNDDYVKFIRFGQYFVEKNGEGILAFINSHSFLDNPTFRGMRWNLLNSFDQIFIIDLHGNAKKKERSPDGQPDKNVFDIQAGVSINIFIKSPKFKNGKLGTVKHFDVFGSRETKHNFLFNNSLSSIKFKKIKYTAPFYFFNDKNEFGKENYERGFKIDELFLRSSVGFVTAHDNLNISMSSKEQTQKINDLLSMNEVDWRIKYKRSNDARDWTYNTAKQDAEKNFKKNKITKITYRPFDDRWTCYTGTSRGLYSSPQPKILKNLLKEDNIGLIIGRAGQVVGSMEWNLAFVTDKLADFNVYYRGGGLIFPLFLYNDDSTQKNLLQDESRILNLNRNILNALSKAIDLRFDVDVSGKSTYSAIDVLDYIYAILYSPKYRETYKEFLAVDFPKIPYPKNKDFFKSLSKLGSELRHIHLLKHKIVDKVVAKFPIEGDNIVKKITYKNNEIYINDSQCFTNVSETVWNFYIGGYQPIQKWLKDRKDLILTFEDIVHYQRMITAISQTINLMDVIDGIFEA